MPINATPDSAELKEAVSSGLSASPPEISNIDTVAVSSVVPAMNEVVRQIVDEMFSQAPLFVDSNLDLGIEIRTDDPASVGADRMANAVATAFMYKTPAIVVDFGTATTVDAIDAERRYLGGAIAPGLETSHDALVSRAALLDPVQLVAPRHVLARDTASGVQAGLVLGHLAMIEGLVVRAREELGTSSLVLATGGLADLMAEMTTAIDKVDRDLTLQGIRIVHERNMR